MSTFPKYEQLSIEEILEQIRTELSVQPLSLTEQRAEKLNADPLESDCTYGHDTAAAGAEFTHHTANEIAAHSADVEWVWNATTIDAFTSHEDVENDLPSVFKREPDHAPGASVHAFPHKPRSRLTDALRKGRAADASQTMFPPATLNQPVPSVAVPESRPATVVDPGSTSGAALASPSRRDENGDERTANVSPPKREMISFLDTRFKNLASTSKAPQADVTTHATKELPVRAPSTPAGGAGDVTLDALVAAVGKASPDAISLSHQDAAALIRPMLEKWLLENMPRMIEEAISAEMRENTMKTVRNRAM